jgi:NitT/TauT family transport system permease protein
MNLARNLSSRIGPALTFIGLLLIWELIARLRLVPAFLLPAPSDIVRAFGSIPASAWLQHIFATVEVALMGLVAATAVSIPIAIALSRSRFLSQTLYPLLVVVRSLPIVAIAPIIIALAGTGNVPRVIITFLITFFPIVVSTVAGLDQVPPELIELSRSLKASMRREMLDVRLPAAIPYIFASLKVASTLVVTGAVVAEFVAADQGIGYVVVVSTSSFKMAMAFAALVVLVLLSLILFYSIDLIQRWFFPWSLPKQS